MPDPAAKRYVESEGHVPNPTDVIGTIDTSGTGGGDIREQSAVFAFADRADLRVARRALDPDDPDVPASLVVLPEGVTIVTGDSDAARERVRKAAEDAEHNDISLLSVPPGAQEAAKEHPEGDLDPDGRLRRDNLPPTKAEEDAAESRAARKTTKTSSPSS